MAQKVVIELLDDIDGSQATETVTFGLDGRSYEIDLNDKNADKLRKSLSVYVGSARSAGRQAVNGAKKRAVTQFGPSAREVRDWARTNGYDVPDRGRIPADVREAFDAAH